MGAIGGPKWRHGRDIDWVPNALVADPEGTLSVAELIGLLQQLPGDARVEVQGDENVPPALDVLVPGHGRTRLLNPHWPDGVDHRDGRVTR